MKFNHLDKNKILAISSDLKKLQDRFLEKYGVNDIFSNSKIFEIIIANELKHTLIPGHSGSRDAKDKDGGEVEYKHFKERSSNHSWTFNDYSESTIEKLSSASFVIFAHINDTNNFYEFDWYYKVTGRDMSNYLKDAILSIRNNRKMINVGPSQIENKLNIEKTFIVENVLNGEYSKDLNEIYENIKKLEEITFVENILTSNKIWEVLTSIHLNHNVNSEQGGRLGAHDAYDEYGNQYEYKIAKTTNWNFQDISDAVLSKYKNLNGFILANKKIDTISISKIYIVNIDLLKRVKEKLNEKKIKFTKMGKELRRKSISITLNDIKPYIENELTIN